MNNQIGGIGTNTRRNTMKLNVIWASWGDIHDQDAQVKRINSAKKIDCTPISINRNSYSGVFQGRKSPYITLLEECQCMDFKRQKKPCKHIYRLAMELNLIEGQYQSDLQKIINQLSLDEGISLINSVSDDSQQTVKEYLYQHLYQKRDEYGFLISDNIIELIKQNIFIVIENKVALFDSYGRNDINKMVTPYNLTGFKKNWKKEVLVEWIISNHPNIVPEITKDSIVVSMHPQFTKTKRKVYSHLNKKFERDLSYLWE